MSELNDIQKNFTGKRRQLTEINSALQAAHAKLEKLKADEMQELKGLDDQSRKTGYEQYTRLKREQSAEISKLSTQKKSLVAGLHDLSLKVKEFLNPVETISHLNDSFPILMFPVKLETRFKNIDGQPQLWLRVYPDDCNINHKEEILSESELVNAKSFWIEIWKAGGIEEEERGAWKSLVNAHGSGRAEWIINQFKPVNSKPVKPDTTFKTLVVISSMTLSNTEHAAARDYWAAVWLAKGNKAALDYAFDALKATVGNALAVDITENYVPKNLGDNIPKDLTNDHILLAKLDLPSSEYITTSRISWTQAPKTMGLPDRFVAVAFTSENKRTVPFDNPVKDNLPVGPDPSLPEDEQMKKDENGDLIINEELKWMVDFEKAVSMGMGAKINLSSGEAQNGFDKLYVVGIRLSSDETDGKNLLEKMFNDHFLSKSGFGLLKQGTPTNNTQDNSSGYSWLDNSDESYDRVFKQIENFTYTSDPSRMSDGQKLAEVLGIDPEFLKKVPNANGCDQMEAIAMNKALFPATLGYFIEEMMTPLFNERDIRTTKTFFTNYVSGRGPVPAIRIGRQPYGILPVSVFSHMNFTNTINIAGSYVPLISSYLIRLHNLVKNMDAVWENLLPNVEYVGKNGDPHQVLLDVVGLHANSVEFHQRYAQSIKQIYNNLNLQFGATAAKKITSTIASKAKSILSQLGINLEKTTLPILDKYFLSKPNLLSGPVVDDVPDSEFNIIRAYDTDGNNYIGWLARSTADKIRMQDFGGNPAPTALLYLLLRSALMQAQANAASQLLVSNKIITTKSQFYDPDFIHLQKENGGKSKFEHLYNKFPGITGTNDIVLAEYIYTPAVLQGSPETKDLKETIDAIEMLENTPTARLERLFSEHLDCCNYRLDAWQTGLVNYKLQQQRAIGQNDNKSSQGLYLGAYGLLLEVRPEHKILEDVVLTDELNKIFNNDKDTPLQTDSTNLGYIHAPSLNQASAAAILRNAFDSNKGSGTGNPFTINLTSDRIRIAGSFLEGMRNGQSLSSLLGYQFERGLHDKYYLGQDEVDKFIYPLRKAFPLVADNLKDTKSDDSDSIETIQANNVIDGLKLIHHVGKSTVKTYPFGLPASYNLPSANATQSKAINDEVNRISEIHDAIGDLVLSEQVYQVVQGNFERASGNAEAFSKGSYPPDIDIMTTPRSGFTLTQRMAIHFDPDTDPAVSPNTVEMTPRAKAEPGVNAWLSSILPAPENVMCKVSYTSPVNSDEIKVTQKDLGLQPIDLLYSFNLDIDQAMTELDDRITNYIRYEISKHPKTDVFIKYTEKADEADNTKISFFELAAIVKSLRKLLIGAKSLTPLVLTLPQEEQPVSDPDYPQMESRISTLMNNELKPVKTNIEAILSGAHSIPGLTESLKTSLNADISDTSKIESLLSQFKTDLKEYASDPTTDNKNTILDAYEEAIQSIGDATKISDLKISYGNKLVVYEAGLAAFDTLVENTIVSLLTLAKIDNTQTGTGSIHQQINNIYNDVFKKLDLVINRWEQKLEDFNTIMTGYNPLGVLEEQFDLLKKAERLINPEPDFPLPADFTVYKTQIDGTLTLFNNLLIEMKALKTNTRQKVTEFIDDCAQVTRDISKYDMMAFDTIKDTNTLKPDKLKLIMLREDVLVALESARTFIDNKLTTCTGFLDDAGATVINTDKVTALQNAAKSLLGEEALLLPRFKLEDPQATEFENSYNTSESLLNFVKTNEKRIFPAEDWLGGVSRIREKIRLWEDITFLSNAFKSGVMLEITPLQFPWQENDRWLAMKFRDETKDGTADKDKFSIMTDKLLYTAHFATNFDKTKFQCGIILDEWTEVIPSGEETTGIAFHYDQPNTEPPQTMLLVTAPEIKGTWKWEDIIDSITETLEMAKKRAVEPAQIETTGYAQFLPATMMAVTLYWITVATNLAINNNIYKIIESD